MESTPPPTFSEGSVAESPLGIGGIQPGDCPAELGDYPVPYFGDHVLIRLPVGVNEDNFVEFTPGVFVRSTGPIESSNCHADMPGAVIQFMALAAISEQPVPDRPIATLRDEMLEAFGYPETIVLVERDDDPNEETPMWVYEVPADPQAGEPEPAKTVLAMRVAHGQTFALVFEVHPNAWSVMVDSLVASAQQLTVLPP